MGDVILTTVDTAAAWRVEKPITLAAIAAFVASWPGRMRDEQQSPRLDGDADEGRHARSRPAATHAGQSRDRAGDRRTGRHRQAAAEPARYGPRPEGHRHRQDHRQGRVSAARLHRVRARESRHQGLLHLGRDRSRRQARQPHHGRGTRRRGAGQGPVGVGQRAAHPEHRRQDRRVARDLAAEPQERGGGEQRCHRHRLGPRRPSTAVASTDPAAASARRRRRPTRRRGASAATPA